MRFLGFNVAIVAITNTIVVGEIIVRASVVSWSRSLWKSSCDSESTEQSDSSKAIFSIRDKSEVQIILDIGEAVDIYSVTGHYTIRMQ
jgi:hypothetical protein